jgi:hypothetical protein
MTKTMPEPLSDVRWQGRWQKKILSLCGSAMARLWTLTTDNVQQMQVTVFIRWIGDGLICHVQNSSQLQENNVRLLASKVTVLNWQCDTTVCE